MRRYLLSLLFGLSLCLGASAQVEGDSVEASLLTCSPGREVYSLYAHTAIRVRNLTQGIDAVFNYGAFDFTTEHFLWRFILGKCDYEIQAMPFKEFVTFYQQRGSGIVEQHLNLTNDEANRLFALLVINCQPQNRTYRYNLLTNNCTTKARDQIEAAVDGNVVYEEMTEHPTCREVLHEYTEDYPWVEQGNDLLLGAACDTVMSARTEMFLPERLMAYFAQAQIYDEINNRRPLVSKTTQLLVARNTSQPQEKGFPLSPLLAGLVALGVFLLIMLLEYAVRRMLWGVDIVVMTVQGLAGCVLCFMFLFSQHPMLDSNWQVALLNPIPLLCMPWVVKCAFQHRSCLYHYLNFLWLVLFIVFMPWIPQHFSTMTLPVALALLTRPVSYYIHYNRRTPQGRVVTSEKGEEKQK